MKGKLCGLAAFVAMGAVDPAFAWQQFVSANPSFVHNLAPQGALSVNASGEVCLLSNDRVYGQIQFAHIFTFDPYGGMARPWQAIGHPNGFSTFGMDCRFGPPVIGTRWIDSGQRHDALVGYSDDRSSYWSLDLWSLGAAYPSRFGAASAQAPVVLREKPHGGVFGIEGFGAAPPTMPPQWSAWLSNGAYPGAKTTDFEVAAGGSSVLLGTYDLVSDPTEALFVQHFDTQGQSTYATSIVGDFAHPEIGPTAVSPNGVAYYVRRASPLVDDELWRIDPQGGPPQWMPINFGAPQLVQRLVALADDGVLVLSSDSYGSFLSIARYTVGGIRLWQTTPIEIQAPRTVLDLIGDRAGRALVVSVDPPLPALASRTVRLSGYDDQGYSAWMRDVYNVRFDEGGPVALALTSDDRAVVALNSFDSQGVPGILLQSFTLDSAVP